MKKEYKMVLLHKESYQELKRLAKIGEATERAFDKTDVALFTSYWKDDIYQEKYVDELKSFNFDSVEDLMEWYESEDY